MAGIFGDNFDSYNNGDLNGQGGWSGNAAFDVQGTVVQAGAKAVSVLTASVNITKTGNSLTDGEASFYMRKTSVAGSGHGLYVHFQTSAPAVGKSLRFIDSRIGFLAGTQLTTTAVADTWYFIEVEWHSSPSYEFRARLDGGAWTAWEARDGDGPYDRLQLEEQGDIPTSYIDEMGPAVVVAARNFQTLLGVR